MQSDQIVNIRIYSPDIVFLGEVRNFTSLIFNRKWESIGSFEIHLKDPKVGLFVVGNYIMVNNDPHRSGIITSITDDRDGYQHKSTKDLTVKGYTLLYYLTDRGTLPPAGKDYYAYNNVPAEDVMYDLVNQSAINPTDSARKLPNLVAATNQHRGIKITFQSRLKYVSDELNTLSVQSGLSPTIWLDAERNRLVFEVLKGVDRSWSMNNPNNYIFSRKLKKIGKQTQLHSMVGTKTMAYVAGQGDGADREIITVNGALSGYDRKEMMVDARDIAEGATDLLKDRGQTKLKECAEVYAVEFEAYDMDYRTGWNLGDICTYEDDAGQMRDDIITEVQETYENGKTKAEPTFGHTPITPVNAIKNNSIEVGVERTGVSASFKYLYAENATIQNLVAEKADIKDLTAVTATIETLRAQTAEIQVLVADKASITDLNAANANIKKLTADVAALGDLSAVNADIEHLKAADAQITEALIKKADIDTLDANYAKIDLANIKAGCITTAMIGTGVVNTAQIADGSITDAKIVGLTANKITAGRLDAAEIEVVNLKAANITVGTINGTQIAPGAITGDKLGQQVNDLINGAVSGAQQAQTTADGKNKIYYQNTQPGLTGNKKGDTWFDTANGYRAHVWNGTAWSLSPFGSAAIADDAVTLAKVGADLQSFMDGINTKATTAQTSADGKNTVFYQGTAPSTVGRKVGDAWFNSADGNRLYTWNGSAWAVAPFGSNAIASLSVTNAQIANGAIDNAKIANLDAGKITAGVLAAARIGAGSITADKLASKSITVGQINDVAIKAINDLINIGSRNLLRKSGTSVTNTEYLVQTYAVVGLKPNTVYTVVMNGNTSTAAKYMGVWFNGGSSGGFSFPVTTTAKTQVIKVTSPPTLTVQYISIYQPPSSTAGSATINWIAMYEGDIKPPMDWTPAPEDDTAAIATNSIANWCYNNNLTYINGGKIYTGTVNANQIAANAIVAGKIAANAVTSATIAAGAINADKLAVNSINASKIVAGCITAAQIATGTITATQIAGGTITATQLAANAITADKIVAGAITGAKIAASTITGNNIAANTITSGNILAGTITAADIASGTITATQIAAGTITADKIAAGAITADKFYGTSITSKNYVANSAGTKINLADGTIDTKNFKVSAAGDVSMTGALTMQGAQTITVKNASAQKVGHVAFKAVSGETWSPGALSVYGDGLLQLAAGDTNSTKAFVSGWAGGYQLFEMSRESSARGVWMGTSAVTRIGVNSTRSPQVYAEGCTVATPLVGLNGFKVVGDNLFEVTKNAMGNFCVLNCVCSGTLTAGVSLPFAQIPAGFRPKKGFTIVVVEAGRKFGIEISINAATGIIEAFRPSASGGAYLYFTTQYYV